MLGRYQDPEITRRNGEAIHAAILRLEAERFDISYKDFAPKREPKLTPGEKRVLEEDLMAKGRKAKKPANEIDGKTIWNAGRYAAGARDQAAQEANAKMRSAKGLK
jgi:hypothetical protein